MEKMLLKKRVLIGHIFTLLVLAGARKYLPLQLGGALLVVVGIAVRIWAAGCLYKDQTVCTTGPYRHLRNPLYLGSFLIFLGFVLMSAQVAAAVLFVLFFPPLYFFTMKAEERFLLSKYPKDYTPFFNAIPRFFPKLKPSTTLPPSKPFTWDQVKVNKEYEGALGSVLTMALLCLLTLVWPKGLIVTLLNL